VNGVTSREIHIHLASKLQEVDQVCPVIVDLLTEHGLQVFHFGIELVARELLNNAILHGNKQERTKKVKFSLRIGRRWIRLQVIDEGNGFNWRHVRQQPPDVSAESGRGIAIARVYGQRIVFGNGGRKIEVWFDRSLAQTGGV
jgi:serine/threonine-protein kinase RsbW